MKSEPGMEVGKEVNARMHTDHDYTALYPGMKIEPGRAWIDEDAPPLVNHLVSYKLYIMFDVYRKSDLRSVLKLTSPKNSKQSPF